MSSPVKDAFTEFINNSPSNIERAMENASHGDTAKVETDMTDLINYLSGTNQQPPYSKDSEPMSTNKMTEPDNSSFIPVELQVTPQAHITQAASVNSQFNNDHVYASICEGSYTSDSQMQHVATNLHQDLQHQQPYPNSLSSHDQTASLFLDQDLHTNSSSSFQDAQLTINPLVFENSRSGSNQSLPNTTGSESQGCQSMQAAQFMSETVEDYNSHQQAQIPNTENTLEQIHNQTEASTNSFKISSVLNPSFPSSSEADYVCTQNVLGFGVIGGNQTSMDNIETAAHQFRASEKMHIDDPEAVYQQTDSSTNQFQIPTVPADSDDVHMQSFNTSNFQTQTVLDPTQASIVTCNDFQQSLVCNPTSNSNNNFVASLTISSNTNESPPVSNIYKDPYQSPPGLNSFINQNFQQSPAVLQQSTDSPFQEHSIICQTNDGIINPLSDLPQNPQNLGVPAQHTYMSSQPSSFDNNQHVDVPDQCNHLSNNEYSFQLSITSTSASASQGFNPIGSAHYQQPPQIDTFHQNPTQSMNYNTEASQGLELQSVGFQSNVEPHMSNPTLFPQSSIDIDQNQKNKFLTDSVQPSSTELKDHSPFISYNSVKDPLLSEICASVTQSSQSLGDFEMSPSSNQGHTPADQIKTTSDMTMNDFSSGSHLHPPSHSGFTVDFNPFSQLELEAVVTRFQEEANAPSNPQNDSVMTSAPYQSHFHEFGYNKQTTTSASFPEIASTTDASNPNFTFNQPCQADQNLCPSQTTCASVVSDQNITDQFQTSNFILASTPEGTNRIYPQPMQVQDSHPHSTYSFSSNNSSQSITNNTEIAMDVSSSLGERTEVASSSKISYEQIHMSIVEAGNALAKEVRDTKLIDPLSATMDSLGIFSTNSSDAAHDKSSSTTASHVSFLTASTNSETMQHEIGSVSDVTASSASTSNTILNDLVDSSIFSGILNNLQMSQDASNQEQMNQQAPLTITNQQASVTIPNFLETPAVLGTQIHASNPDDAALATSISQDQSQASFIGTSSISTNPGGLGENSSVHPSMVADAQRESFSTLKQVLNFPVSQASSMPSVPQIFGSQASSSLSFFNQVVPDVIDLTSETGNSMQTSHFSHVSSQNLNLDTMPVDSVSSSSSNTFFLVSSSPSGHVLQLPSLQSENKTSTLSSSIDCSVKIGAQQQAGHKPGIFSGLTLGVTQSGGGNQISASSSSKQPQIVVSLDDLQRLLAQQNLSQPSPSIPQQQPYTTISSSPQTLVLQKHASHSLKQSQPKFLIKGATLPSLPRHQSQQIRDRLQLLYHQSHNSENSSTGISSQRKQEPTPSFMPQETHQKSQNPFQFASTSHKGTVPHKLTFLHQTTDQNSMGNLQAKQPQGLQQSGSLFLQQGPKSSDQKLAPLQLAGSQSQNLVLGHNQAQNEQKLNVQASSHQKGQGSIQKGQDVIQMQQELLLLLKQQGKMQDFEEKHRRQLRFQHKHNQQGLEKLERSERPCSDSLRKGYKHLHSLLTLETSSGTGSSLASTLTKSLPSSLNLANNLNLQGQSSLQLTNGGKQEPTSGKTPAQTLLSTTQPSAAPFSFCPLNSNSLSNIQNFSSAQPNASLTKLAFVKTPSAPTFSKAFDSKDSKTEASAVNSRTSYLNTKLSAKLENSSLEKPGLDNLVDKSASQQGLTLTHTSTERKRSHTPLSIDLNSPADSSSEAASPLVSPPVCEDGNTQLTLIERSADLHIKSDSMHGIDDSYDDNDNASFDVNAFHKRPSADEFHSSNRKTESVPMKVAKPSINADAHSSLIPLASSESTFNFGSAVSSASNFSFVFGNKEENNSELFTFGLGSTAATPEALQLKEGPKTFRTTSSKPVVKTVAMRSSVPTQPVRPTSRKQQKEHSLKAYYPNKMGNMELKILQQPEPQHRARYQTEGSRGAIKDASQQGFPVIKLFGYSKPTKLQVFIGDECGRVKPHGFYQACRVFGKNSTACQEQEIEDTTVIEMEMMPENDMTVKLDCVGILKLRNADVERRIGPKRAREKKKTNTRARLVMRCFVEKSDGSQQILQVVSSPILCTQPAGQPEICRMSLTEDSVKGGESLFLIGKNFKNKGTTVLFQQFDSNDEHVIWQVEAEIEQEYFQPTHVICKIPPYRDQTVDLPQLVQILVSCAGKRSDPHSFTYKPVYPFMKPEVKMDTDNSSSRSVIFVSPDMQLPAGMVHIRSSNPAVSTTSTTFQLPQDTIQITATEPPVITTLSSHFSQPVQSHISSQPDISTTVTTSSSSSINTPSASSEALTSFFLEEKTNELDTSTSREPSMNPANPASVTDDTGVNYNVHNNSETATPTSHVINDISHQHPLTSSLSDAPPHPSSVSGFHDVSSEIPSTVSKTTQSPLPLKPFFLRVDPEALQSHSGGDKTVTTHPGDTQQSVIVIRKEVDSCLNS